MPGQTHMKNNTLPTLHAILAAALFLCGSPFIAQGQAPAATPAPAAEPAQQATESGDPPTLHLLVGRSLVITSPSRIKRVSLADPDIAEAIVVSPTQVLVNGKKPGGVSLLIWDESDQSQAFEVSVDIDVL